jgi:hypothetical protein
MVRCLRNLVQLWVFLLAVWNAGCTCVSLPPPETETNDTTTTTTTTTTTEDLGPCGMDCSKIETPPCTGAVCNTGQVVGPLNTCIVVPLPKGAPCDDGYYCTIDDFCDSGVCAGGSANDCGIKTSPCESVTCYEQSKSCDVTPVNDGSACTPDDLCEVNGVCQLGECIGEPKDCSFAPGSECNKMSCDEATGKCVGMPDLDKDDDPCVLTGDVCRTNKTCKAGVCGGGVPKDCTALDVGCEIGACEPVTGICKPEPAPVGTSCTEGIHECDVGACDDKGTCVASPEPNGIACNDHNACTKSDKCMVGVCGGTPVAGCVLYLNEGFETCPAGWTFGGDWECGTPENVGPLEAHTGSGVIATQIAGLYHVNQSFTTTVADSPPIDLTMATSPQLTFWAWDHSEGGSFDGWNLKVSTDGGQSYTVISDVTPAYDLMIANQPAWGGNHSSEGWRLHSADLTAYAGQTIRLRFAFRSDGATVFPGVYLDDLFVAEPQEIPIFITTPSPLLDAYEQLLYSVQLTKTGGTSNAVWTINQAASMNAGWLMMDPMTGVLSGTPKAADIGPVTVSVHVEEPGLPSNYADATYTFNVNKATYYTSFEDVCPNGWTLTGDWECGVPMTEGPATAYVGAQCLATKIAGKYSNLQPWAGTTATSPDIDLTGAMNPKLTFVMWVKTEGSTYDGFNLQISTNGGMSYTIVDNAMPPYPLTVGGKPAWGGHQEALGWQPVQADLSAYAGQKIRLRFAFRSDSSNTYAGVYIDDLLIH